MATRRDVFQRKNRLIEDLRVSHRNGDLMAGDLAPSLRDLAQKYELSVGLVSQQMQTLVNEGLFYTVAGAGTFVGRKTLEEPEFYLFVLTGARREDELKAGFEEEIARRGGTTLVMTPEQVIVNAKRAALPKVAGIYLFRGTDDDVVLAALAQNQATALPEVDFDDLRTGASQADVVNFADAEGGQQAVRHLLHNGHQEIAFMGIHAPLDSHDCGWSVRRMEGWSTALHKANIETEGLSFLPQRVATRSQPDSAMLLRETAEKLLGESRATAVIAASDDAALQLIEACREAALASESWPAIVSFDGTLQGRNHALTSLRLPWEELGRLSASTLWERTHHQLTGAPVTRHVSMRIIARLTCQANWTLAENLQTIS